MARSKQKRGRSRATSSAPSAASRVLHHLTTSGNGADTSNSAWSLMLFGATAVLVLCSFTGLRLHASWPNAFSTCSHFPSFSLRGVILAFQSKVRLGSSNQPVTEYEQAARPFGNTHHPGTFSNSSNPALHKPSKTQMSAVVKSSSPPGSASMPSRLPPGGCFSSSPAAPAALEDARQKRHAFLFSLPNLAEEDAQHTGLGAFTWPMTKRSTKFTLMPSAPVVATFIVLTPEYPMICC